MLVDGAEESQPIQPRHVVIREQDIGHRGLQHRQGGFPIGGWGNLEAFLFEEHGEQETEGMIVIDEQNMARPGGGGLRAAPPRARGTGGRRRGLVCVLRLVFAAGVVRMSITVNGDVLQEATVQFTRLGPQGFTVTVQIDPCWFEYVNEREATASEFGDDVMARIEEQRPGAIEPCLKEWLAQRLALLGAKTAEPFVKGGVILVPPRG